MLPTRLLHARGTAPQGSLKIIGLTPKNASGKGRTFKMNNSLRVSSTVSLCGIIGGLAFTVTPALAEEPAERAEVASVEEGTAPQLRSEDATNPGSYPAEPDSGSNVAAQSQTRNREPRLGGHVGIAT